MKNYFIKISTLMESLACAIVCMFMVSCNNDAEEPIPSKESRIIDVTPISTTPVTRTFDNNYIEGYHCTSNTSSLVADIYINAEYSGAWVNMLNKENEVAYCIRMEYDGIHVDSSLIQYTAYNELGDPIMSGTYNMEKAQFDITQVYGNDVVTRASAAAWGCNLGLFVAGLAWSVPAGMVSLGASIAISAAYTAAAIQICDGL